MPEWGRIPGMLCTQTLQRAALLSVARGGGGGPPCDHCFVLAESGFLLDAVPALGLVALTLKHCCLQKTVYQSSRVRSAACFAAATSFLGSFWVSREMKHEQRLLQPEQFLKALSPVLLFGFPSVGVGHESPPARAITTTRQKWVPLPPPLSHFWLLFIKSGYYDVFKVWPGLQKPSWNWNEMFEMN